MTNQTADGFHSALAPKCASRRSLTLRCAGVPRDFLYTIICTSHVILVIRSKIFLEFG